MTCGIAATLGAVSPQSTLQAMWPPESIWINLKIPRPKWIMDWNLAHRTARGPAGAIFEIANLKRDHLAFDISSVALGKRIWIKSVPFCQTRKAHLKSDVQENTVIPKLAKFIALKENLIHQKDGGRGNMNPLRDGFSCSVIKTGGFNHSLPLFERCQKPILSAS